MMQAKPFAGKGSVGGDLVLRSGTGPLAIAGNGSVAVLSCIARPRSPALELEPLQMATVLELAENAPL
jgi:hypothetical protein